MSASIPVGACHAVTPPVIQPATSAIGTATNTTAPVITIAGVNAVTHPETSRGLICGRSAEEPAFLSGPPGAQNPPLATSGRRNTPEQSGTARKNGEPGGGRCEIARPTALFAKTPIKTGVSRPEAALRNDLRNLSKNRQTKNLL